mgnify:FL=1
MEEEVPTKELLPSKVKALEGHSSKVSSTAFRDPQVFSCKWCPQSDVLATGYWLETVMTCSSADSTVHLWDVVAAEPGSSSSFKSDEGPVLSHAGSEGEENSITCMDWSVSRGGAG